MMKIIDITKEPRKIRLLYEECLIRNFTDTCELESLENILHYAELAKYRVENDFVIFAVVEDDKYVGSLVGDWYKNSHSAFIEYICVNEEYRNKNYSNLLLQKFDEWLNDSDIAIFLEYNLKHDVNFKTDRNHCIISFWNYKKFNILNFQYIQPPLSEGKEALRDLYLLCNKENITKKDLLKFLYDVQKYSIGIEAPYNNKYYLQMCDNLKNVKRLSFINI